MGTKRPADVLFTPMAPQRAKRKPKATATKARSQDGAGRIDHDKLATLIVAKLNKPTKAQAREVLAALREKYGVCDGGMRFKTQHADLAAILGWA